MSKAAEKNTTKETTQKEEQSNLAPKVALFEEDDYFEEFETNDNSIKRSETEIKNLKEDWDESEADNNFLEVLSKELKSNKATQ